MSADIDIDFFDRSKALAVLKHIIASREQQGELVKHNTGVYLHEIPHNPITNLATIDYKEADQRGFFKIDFLNVSIYEGVRDEEHLLALMNTEPLWDLLLQEDFVNELFHINGHADLLKITQPRSVEQLAAVLAMIRPAKKYLVGQSWDKILAEVWVKPADDSAYYFKHSHSISYAMAIVIQMNLICETLLFNSTN